MQLANWECNVAAARIDQRQFWDAHQCLKRALEDLHRNGMMRDMDILDLPTFHFSGPLVYFPLNFSDVVGHCNSVWTEVE